MKRLTLFAAAAGALIGCLVLFLMSARGMSAREEPTIIEKALARTARRLAVPRRAREMANPVAVTPEVLAAARAHFSDHCAICHASDGSGDTAIGRNLYPKPPDMRASATQSLSDGELYYVIENGVRLSGMPAWGSAHGDDGQENWALVHFIRSLASRPHAELDETSSPKESSDDHDHDHHAH